MTYAEMLICKGKRRAAACVQAECTKSTDNPNKSPQHLNALLDHLLNPEKNINDQDTIDWIQWLIGGGLSYEDFARNLREYDNTSMCGLVWTADFVAFRCRTCGISQCMSLCAGCFKDGNHIGHDFNMFKSQAGGACDCGDASVLKTSGFCSQHHRLYSPKRVPRDLICVAENMLPRIILRLVQHLRINTIPSDTVISPEEALARYERTINNANLFLKLLHDFASLGSVMRTVMTRCLLDKDSYAKLTQASSDSEYAAFMRRSQTLYEDALRSLPNPEPPREFQDCATLTEQLTHQTFLEELVFWMVKYEFPEILVCLFLKLLPDTEYKEAFTRSFILHYSRVSMTLVTSSNSDKLSNRIVHVSVQLFSNKVLALSMTENLSLLHIMVFSLKNMMSGILIPGQLHDTPNNKHMVVDCSTYIMRNHCYWPLVSDLNNVLSHQPIAFKFMSDNSLLTMWFDFLQMLQGMNVNERELKSHVEYESSTYHASFSGELEASSSPMWALVSHLKDASTRDYTSNVLKHCIASIRDWFTANQFTSPDQCDMFKVSFHIPLHRNFAVFVRQAVRYQGFSLNDVLPDPEMLSLMMAHPLRVQVAFYEIMCGLWVRNGVQIKGQVMTYLQCHFCKSFVDADIFLLQLCATQLPPMVFLSTVLDRFQINDWLSLSPNPKPSKLRIDKDQVVPMLESFLTFLISILVLRTNLGLDEKELARLEMVTLLCIADRQHSKLFEHMPEKCGNPIQLSLFDEILYEVGQYRAPQSEACGIMQQGIYLPKSHVWEDLFDPIYVLLRAVNKIDFQTSMDRFYEYARNRSRSVQNPWPPWRLPAPCDPGFEDPRRVLHSRFSHGLIFNILYKCVHGEGPVSEQIMSSAIHLLELSLTYPQTEFSGKEVAVSKPWLMVHEPVDLKYDTWFPTDWLSANLRHTVSAIFTEAPSSSEVAATDVTGASGVAGAVGGSSNDGNGPTSMEVDTINPNEDEEGAEGGEDYQVETPTSLAPIDKSLISLAITGPAYSGGTEIILSGPNAITPMSWSVDGATAGTADGATAGPSREAGAVASTSTSPEIATTSGAVAAAGTTSGPSGSMRSVVSVNESIISLLLQLHSKLSNRPDSYVPITERTGFSTTQECRESRIGDGCFFVGKVLDRIVELDEMCAQNVKMCRTRLWPSYHNAEARKEQNQERVVAEKRKRKANERKKQMLEKIAQQQRRFMQNAMGSEFAANAEESSSSRNESQKIREEEEEVPLRKREYECVHCHLMTPSTKDRPVGLVVLLQSTSVLAHRHRETSNLSLPTSTEEESYLSHGDSLGNDYEERFVELSHHFDPQSYLLGVNKGWEGGIHIQSCGHHLHLSCQESYMEHLRSQQRAGRFQTLSVEDGEYMCPMCRQLANSVLPVPPDSDNAPVALSPPESLEGLIETARHILGLTCEESFTHRMEGSRTAFSTNLHQAMSQIMEHFMKVTLPQYRLEGSSYPTHVVVLFVNSIARINLELDLVQRGGTLIQEVIAGASASPSSNSGINRPKTCFVPLLHVLALHMKVMFPRSLLSEWMALTGLHVIRKEDERKIYILENSMPLLLQDCTTLFLHFILLLPVQMDIAYFNTLVKAIYNLHLVQSLSRLTSGLSDKERDLLKTEAKKCQTLQTLSQYLGHIIEYFESCFLYPSDLDFGETDVEMLDLEVSVQELALPFLRIASLIRHYVYEEPLPECTEASKEFPALVRYLEIVVPRLSSSNNETVNNNKIVSVDGFNWFEAGSGESRLALWCSEYAAFCSKSPVPARQLLQVNTLWKQPQLLKLPMNYDAIFQFYYKKPCSVCQTVPKDPSVCLLCGVLVCLRETCCRSKVLPSKGICEAVLHSLDCGAGTAMYLAVNSSTIVVLRGRRACIWGSIYLDSFGEEDRELKRGKPLFLNEERYMLLQKQWLTHRFDHTNRNWIWHRDQL